MLITEGATSTIFPEYNLTPGITIEEPQGLYVRGSVLKAVLADRSSPVLYGYDQNALAVYFNQAPVFGRAAAALAAAAGGGPQIPGVGQNMPPNAVPETLTTLDAERSHPGSVRLKPDPTAADGRRGGAASQMARAFGCNIDEHAPRVLLSFPTDPNDLLLSGVLVGGEALAGRAVAIDAPSARDTS